MRRPEVLAPAGDEAALDAAIRGGADAVYFGLHGFNARARATNFDEGTLAATLDKLHAHGVKGYVTLNTLVFDVELPRIEAAIRACAAAGADAIIVQDLGVALLARAIAPDLPVHASTQMTCTDAGSVGFAAALGAKRVVVARELSISEIAAIGADPRSGGAELEVFVHGALCIAYSGQCLTSEAIGGRSANRGACAQACRLPYELVVDGELRDLGDHAHLLSPEDLEATALAGELAAAGVASFKIEGRLKGADYVFSTTRVYREAIDGAISPDHLADALQTFSRGSGTGFLGGTDHQRLVDGRSCDHRGVLAGRASGACTLQGKTWLRVALEAPLVRGDGVLVEGGFGGEGELGGRVWALATPAGAALEEAKSGDALMWLGPDVAQEMLGTGERRLFRTSSPSVDKRLALAMDKERFRTPLAMTISGVEGEPAVLRARSLRDGRTAEVRLDAPTVRATTSATDRALLEDKLGRLGDTPFGLSELTIELPPGVLVPMSALNRARRALVAALEQGAHRAHAMTHVTAAEFAASAVIPARSPSLASGLFVLCRSVAQAEAALDAGADGVYLDFLELTGTGRALRALRARGAKFVGVAPPRIRKPGEEKIDRYLDELGADAVLVRGLGALREPSRAPKIGDFSLNVANRLTAAEVLRHGLVAFTPSFDLDATQLTELLGGERPLAPLAELVVHHPMPLFHMEHCVIAALLSEGRDHKTCGRPCDRHAVSLRDRAGMDHPVEADVGCRNTVFHAAAQSAAGLVPKLRELGVDRFRIELVREDRAQVTRIVESYRALLAGTREASELFRTLRADGGYGVVRGSLRVL